MAWVLLANSGIAFQFLHDDLSSGGDLPGLPDNVALNAGDSRLTLTNVGSALSYSSWTLRLTGVQSARIRVTAHSFDGGVPDGVEYGAAYFAYMGPTAPADTIDNSTPPNSGRVRAFAPSPFEVEIYSDPGSGNASDLYYGSSSYYDGESFVGLDGSWSFVIEVWAEGPPAGDTKYNCECDDGQPTVTLKQMRERLARRLGFSVQVAMGALPPGMPELLDDFTRSAHEFLYQRYSVMRLRRMFTWDMVPGVRFYDIDGNRDDCPRVLNTDKLEWVGISQGDSSWQPLICGISPVLYGSAATGIPSHYEIRQCIEVWPAPTDASWQLRIKGDFGASPLDTDGDVLTADPEAVFLQALANAKAHYGMADAGNYASQATAYIRSRVAGSHQTRRYVPGSCVQPPAVRPLLKED